MIDVAATIERLMLKEARWAYWQVGTGPMFVYNTERLNLPDLDDPAHGCFESAVFVPYGKGSRTGTATRFKELEGSRARHELRRDAKARALRLFKDWKATGEIDV